MNSVRRKQYNALGGFRGLRGININDTKQYFQLKGKNAEKIVHDLALKTFMIDWCYLNPMIKSGKELCDLLVVFDNIVIVWQVKDLKLDRSIGISSSAVPIHATTSVTGTSSPSPLSIFLKIPEL